jgi:hypothetical protein
MNTEEYIIYLDGLVKQLKDNAISTNESVNDRFEKVISMLKMVKDDLDNIFVRLDKLEDSPKVPPTINRENK